MKSHKISHVPPVRYSGTSQLSFQQSNPCDKRKREPKGVSQISALVNLVTQFVLSNHFLDWLKAFGDLKTKPFEDQSQSPSHISITGR